MIRKKGRIMAGKHHLMGLLMAAGAVSALWCQSIVSLADTTGKVTVGSAVIREKASTDSEAVGSAVQGATVTITDEVKDSSGKTWYEVYIDGNTKGYMRSDIVEKEGGDDSQSASDAGQEAAQPQATASGASIDPETPMDAQYATVSSASINVRTAPSAHEAQVEKLTQGAQVVVSGQSSGSDGDGKTWYYVTFTGADGSEKTGYIRSDLLSMGDMVPVPEEEAPEPEEAPAPEPEEPVNTDYELTCEKGEDGSDVWYLYDHTGGEGKSDKYLLEQLMAATRARSEADQEDAKNLVRQRIVIVVLAVLLVALIVTVVVMAFKLRDAYYEDYEDDEDEEEEEEEPPRRRRVQEEEAPRRRRGQEEEDAPRRRRGQEEEDAPRRKRAQEEETPRRRRVQEEEEPPRRKRAQEEEAPRKKRGEEEPPAKRRNRTEEAPAAGGTAQKRKTKNFLLDDDEFEFEFLNMDDKNDL